jgi:hypothetical protein
MSWNSENSKAQQAERGVLSTGLLSFGWRGAADATGHPLESGMGDVDRGYYVGPCPPRASTLRALERACLETQGELDATWGGGSECDESPYVDAFTQWRERQEARRRRWGR